MCPTPGITQFGRFHRPVLVATFAGVAGTSGFADGTGSAARFDFPIGITVDFQTATSNVTDSATTPCE